MPCISRAVYAYAGDGLSEAPKGDVAVKVMHISLRKLRLGQGIRGCYLAALLAAIALLSIVGLALLHAQRATESVGAAVAAQMAAPVLLLDPGHGGEDGGAVGVDGIVEKTINLPVAHKLESFARALGFRTEMTHREDSAIYDASAQTLREKKASDIHNRFAMMEALGKNTLFVSIHQNKFPSAASHGTQVFYSKNHPGSKILAETLQAQVVAQLQPGNTRLAKPSGTEIYLLWNAQIPAVLVECGFLSNARDAALLQQDAYQNQMALAIACGLMEYCGA